jgi:hypothetical protein
MVQDGGAVYALQRRQCRQWRRLTSANNVFIPVYVRANSGDTANRTDVFAVPMRSLPLAAALDARPFRAQASSAAVSDAKFRERVNENILRMMEQRIPGWSQRRNR